MQKDINFNVIVSKFTSSITEKKSSSAINNPTQRKRKHTSSILWLEETYNTARGETALWVAVITQAMMDALSKCKKSESQYNRLQATRWLTDNGKDFIDVCLAAGMNPDYVRRKAKQVLASPSPWRAEAGQGMRYQERKKYRENQQLKKEKSKDNGQPKVISIF